MDYPASGLSRALDIHPITCMAKSNASKQSQAAVATGDTALQDCTQRSSDPVGPLSIRHGGWAGADYRQDRDCAQQCPYFPDWRRGSELGPSKPVNDGVRDYYG